MTNSYAYPGYADSFYPSGHNGINQHNWPNANTTPSYISSMNAINPINSIGTGSSSALTTLTNISAAVAAQNNPLLNHTSNASLSNATCLASVAGSNNPSNLTGFSMLNSTNNSSSSIQSSQTDTKANLLANFAHHSHSQKRKRRILFTQPQVSI